MKASSLPRMLKPSAVRTTALVFVLIALAAIPDLALAEPAGVSNALTNGLQKLIDFLNGGVARSIAILAVMAFGIGALSGRVDWIKALQVVMAIGIIFSASAIVSMFTT